MARGNTAKKTTQKKGSGKSQRKSPGKTLGKNMAKSSIKSPVRNPVKKLGRGLASLIGEIENVNTKNNTPALASDRHIPIEQIKLSGMNPRREFPKEELTQLSQSIRTHGIVQPVLVRVVNDGTQDKKSAMYELVAGERRWRAAQMAGLHKIPAIVRELDDLEVVELALIENIQRADLNPVDEALGYQKLMNEYAYRQEDLAQSLAKSRSYIANVLRLLNLPQKVLDMVASGQLSSGHARTLVPLDDPYPLARKIVKEGLSVRSAEKYAAAEQNNGRKPTKNTRAKTTDDKALERKLGETFGLKFSLNHENSGKGKLVIGYKTLNQLNDFVERIC